MGRRLSRPVTTLPGLVVIDYGNGDIIVLVSFVLLQDHATEGPCNFMGGSPLR